MFATVLLIVNPASAGTKAESSAQKTGTVEAVSIAPVDINKADVDTLATLNGVGKDRAQKIIEYREKNGPFKKPEDIMLVTGIGPKIFEKNKDFIKVSIN
ncbi:MAG: helix-hairpin-helix domain-containing protein [Desulfobacterales bacterium]|nr:MAG: helix-hairpin-helix domain-containing protein [Desulfobacterales bacterium]